MNHIQKKKQILIKLFLPLALIFACLGFAACEQKPNSLSAPQNLKIEGGRLTWDAVDNADGYYVYIDGVEYRTSECSYDVSDFNEDEIHTLEVKAYSVDGLHSSYADMVYTGKYAVPTQNLEYDFFKKGDDAYYLVVKFAVDENGTCIVPAVHQGLPVKGFITNREDGAYAQVKSLYLPNCFDDKYYEGNEFVKFANLENIVIAAGNETYNSDRNCVINKKTNSLVVGCSGSVIPDYVTKIGESAFYGRNSLKEFTVPDHVTEIEYAAFSYCEQLQKIVLPKRLSGKKLTYGFRSCTSLSEIEVPAGVEILKGTFQNCTSLTKVKICEEAKELEETFRGCTALTHVALPQNVEQMDYTFRGCTSLKSVTIPESLYNLYGTFHGCTALESIAVPKNISSLSGTFYGCTALKQVTLEEGLSRISYWNSIQNYYGAFGYCVSLTEIKLPSTLQKIEISSFAECYSLKSIDIPDGVTRIGNEAFARCTSLKSVKLPRNLSGMFGGRIFDNCKLLEAIEIPENITELNDLFANCTSLRSVVLPKAVKTKVIVFNDSPLEQVFYRGTEEEWEENKSNIYNNDKVLFSATRYYYSETQPTEEGNFWRYLDGVPTPW